nr:hypothetical protein BgiMline_018338 [Biomphalaria glabrata]
MERIHPLYKYNARGWAHNVDNRQNWPYHWALIESEKADTTLNPQRSLSASELQIREMPHRYANGIENRSYAWYTYRDGVGRILVRQSTVTTPHSGPVTHSNAMRECHGRDGAYVIRVAAQKKLTKLKMGASDIVSLSFRR